MSPDRHEYPDELNDVIWALMCDGLQGAQIHKKLVKGVDGLPPLEITARVVRDRCHRLRLRRGDPTRTVAAGEEIEVAESIRRRLLEVSRRQVEQLERLGRRRILKPDEANTLSRLSRSVDDMKRRADLAAARKGGRGDPSAAHEDVALNPAESELDRLAALETDDAE